MLVVCPQCMTKNRVPDDRAHDHPTCGRCQAALLPAQPIALNDSNFAHYVAHTEQPIVVDFWAAWCGPCRTMAPQFEQAAKLAPQYRFVKVDTEQAQAISAQYGIRSIPTLMVMQGGREIARQSGVMRAADVVAWVKQTIGS